MRDRGKLAAIRWLHTSIYLLLATSVIFIVVCGVARYRGPWLSLALVLMAIESVVFVGSGCRCPLTALAQRYGAVKGWAFDTYLPERYTRYTFRVFGALLVFGLIMLAVHR
jgi:uncharacterized membrane protein AbrB (regulator of aidB expression)